MHRAKIVEIGGWTLLAAAIAWMVYVLFSRTSVVTTNVGGVPVGSGRVDNRELPIQPQSPPANPAAPFCQMDAHGFTWCWDFQGKQWFIGAHPRQGEAPPFDAGAIQ